MKPNIRRRINLFAVLFTLVSLLPGAMSSVPARAQTLPALVSSPAGLPTLDGASSSGANAPERKGVESAALNGVPRTIKSQPVSLSKPNPSRGSNGAAPLAVTYGLPILYYDFENNTTRTTFENAVEQQVNTGNTALTRAGLSTTITGNSGAGIFNGGVSSGTAAYSTIWPSSCTDPGTAATSYFQFSVNTSGFSGMTLVFDLAAGSTSASYPYVGMLISTNGGASYSALGTYDPGLNTWSTLIVTLGATADNNANVRFRVYGYCSDATSSGTLRLDNIELFARSTVASAGSKTLLNHYALYTSLTSGLTGSVFTEDGFTVTGAGTTVTLGSDVAVSDSFTVSTGGTLAFGTLSSIPNVVFGSGTFTLGSGATLRINSPNGITSSGSTGNVQVSGLRSFSTGGNYEYNGTAAQVTGSGLPAIVANLTINNTTGVTLTSNVQVNGTLALTSGNLITGANTVSQPGSATSTGTGDVVGNVNRFGLATNVVYTFGNPDNRITIDQGTAPNDITVNLLKATPTDFANAVRRTYTITPNGGAVLLATLRLHYLDAELNGNTEGPTLYLWRKDTNTSTWINELQTSNDITNNWVEKSGVTQFSPWTLAGPTGPTLARLESFTATRVGDGNANGTLIEWKTGYEASNLGFNLYRSEGERGQRVKLNPSLIAGSALMAGGGAAPAGQSYSWFDPSSASANSLYWLEGVDLGGKVVMHGPYALQTADGVRRTTDQANSPLLNSVGQSQSTSKPAERAATSPKNKGTGSASTNSLAGQNAIKLSVKGEGLYRVGQPALLAAGLKPNVDPRNIQVYADGIQIPIRVNGTADGRLDSQDSVEFYGVGLDTPTTNTRVYWLVAGRQSGQRIGQVEAAGNPTTGGSFPYTVERKDRMVYFSSLLNGDAENFFGPVVGSAGVAQTLTLSNLDSAAGGQAQLQVALQGVTLQDHTVAVMVNGANVGSVTFAGQARGTATISIPNASLVEGANTVTFTATGAGNDISLVDSVRLTYAHLFRADGDALRLSTQGGSPVTIAGFTSKQIRVFDVTNADAPSELLGRVLGDKGNGGYSVSVAVPGTGARTLVALTDAQARAVAGVGANKPSSWATSAQGADLVIVTHGSLADSVRPLVALRGSQGYKVAVVDVEDIYDEFSYGAHTPYALRDFLAYANTSWQLAPRYLLLAGDSNFDPRNYLGRGELDLVPTKLIDTQNMETASDDWLAGYNSDGAARLAVGRLPVSTVAEANVVIAKIVGYAPGSTQQKAVLVADNNSDGFSFESASHNIASILNGKVEVEEINRSSGSTEEVRGRILDGINAGPMLVNYVGHGNVDRWTGAGLLTSADAGTLSNGNHLPFFVMMTCLNGYAQDPAVSSLAEALVRAPNGGAIASWASSGMTTPGDQAVMSQELYRALFSGTPTPGGDRPLPIAPTLGDAIIQAKASIANTDVRNTWILFGDPTTKLR